MGLCSIRRGGLPGEARGEARTLYQEHPDGRGAVGPRGGTRRMPSADERPADEGGLPSEVPLLAITALIGENRG